MWANFEVFAYETGLSKFLTIFKSSFARKNWNLLKNVKFFSLTFFLLISHHKFLSLAQITRNYDELEMIVASAVQAKQALRWDNY